ncbi:MAG: GNAT family N-acetyltransferase [Pseudomonadales bacterium]
MTPALEAPFVPALAGPVLAENDAFAVHWTQGLSCQTLAEALGWAREHTFRAVGEGTGRPLDLDRFDPHYEHLLLIHKADRRLAGAYRLAPLRRSQGLRHRYLPTLFCLEDVHLEALEGALELGRSFVFPTYQRDPAALYLLWKGIGQCIGFHGAKSLLGPVSVSQDYGPRGQALLAHWLGAGRDQAVLAGRQPLAPEALAWAEAQLPAGADQRAVETVLAALPGAPAKIPVLLRHYLGLGARALGSKIDGAFGNALDLLMQVDLSRLRPAVARRYLGCAGEKPPLGRAA